MNVIQNCRATRGFRRAVNWRILLACASLTRAAVAQAAEPVWELTPYRVRVVLAAEPGVAVSERAMAALPEDLSRRAAATVGPVWELSAMRADRPATRRLRERLSELSASDVSPLLGDQPTQVDKLVLVLMAPGGDGIRLIGREFDTRTQIFGAVAERDSAAAPELVQSILDLVIQAFCPLAEIRGVAGRRIDLRVRGGALPSRDPAFKLVTRGMAFRVVIEQAADDVAEGNPRIRPVEWTILSTTEVKGADASTLMHTGLASPLADKPSPKFRQLALGTRSSVGETRLTIVARAPGAAPLPGYEVAAFAPLDKETVSLGLTDDRGEIVIPNAGQTLRILLVRNGRQPLAVLPLIPGLPPTARVELPDDRERLAHEAIVVGWQERLLDIVARREALAVRAKAKRQAGKGDEARKLVGELRQLPTAEKFVTELRAARKPLSSADPRTQEKTDAMFAELEAEALKHLDPARLAEALATAEGR